MVGMLWACVLASPSSLQPELVLAPASATPDLEMQLAAELDGCRSGIFLDVGSNIGMHARFLFEPQYYPHSTFTQIFDEHFGSAGNRSDVCAVAFEPNPRQQPRFERLAAAYATHGWRVIHSPHGVSDAPGVMAFYHNDGPDNAHEEWQFSSQPLANATSRVDVRTLDLARFLRLLAQRVPSRPGALVIKMDIEASEYAVLPRLVSSGTLCNHVDFITVEFHPGLVRAPAR